MAKRKRLSPPLGAFSPVSEPEMRARPPIADVAGEAASSAALQALSDQMARARAEGRFVLDLPLDAVQDDYLLRDRRSVDDAEMAALEASLKARGQQTPIEVAPLEDGRYGLISGWRRLQALRKIEATTVLAIARPASDGPDAYVAMVEENEIRVGISFYERARIVRLAAQQGVYADEKQALKGLFGSVSRAKRSKIGSFMRLHEALDDVLRFPEAISERQGLALVQHFEKAPGAAEAVRLHLADAPAQGVEAEQAVLSSLLARSAKSEPKQAEPAPDGLSVRTHSDGSITIGGAAFTEEMRAALLAWLQGRT